MIEIEIGTGIGIGISVIFPCDVCAAHSVRTNCRIRMIADARNDGISGVGIGKRSVRKNVLSVEIDAIGPAEISPVLPGDVGTSGAIRCEDRKPLPWRGASGKCQPHAITGPGDAAILIEMLSVNREGVRPVIFPHDNRTIGSIRTRLRVVLLTDRDADGCVRRRIDVPLCIARRGPQ